MSERPHSRQLWPVFFAVTLAGSVGYYVREYVLCERNGTAERHALRTSATSVASDLPARISPVSAALPDTRRSVSIPLQSPMQAAPAQPNQDPRIHRDEVLSELTRSGRDASSPRVGEVLNSFRSLRTKIESEGIRLSDANCYKAGCVASVTFASQTAYHQDQELLAKEARNAWSGPGFLSGPEHLSDGSITASLVLFTDEQRVQH